MSFRYLFSRLTLTVALQRISISWADVTGVVLNWTQDQEISSSNSESRSKKDTAKLLGKCTPPYNASPSLTGSLAMSHELLHPAGPLETKLSQIHTHPPPCRPPPAPRSGLPPAAPVISRLLCLNPQTPSTCALTRPTNWGLPCQLGPLLASGHAPPLPPPLLLLLCSALHLVIPPSPPSC